MSATAVTWPRACAWNSDPAGQRGSFLDIPGHDRAVLILGVPVESFVEQAGRRRSDRPWRPQTLPGLLDAVAAQFPDRPFVIGEEETLSYASLADRSAALARGLIARGVQAGERVALVMPNGPDMIAARFAVARAGAVAVPVSFRLHAPELAQVLRQSEASALITMEG